MESGDLLNATNQIAEELAGIRIELNRIADRLDVWDYQGQLKVWNIGV